MIWIRYGEVCTVCVVVVMKVWLNNLKICTQVCFRIITYICGSISVGSLIYFVKYFSICAYLYMGVVYGKCVHTLIWFMEVTHIYSRVFEYGLLMTFDHLCSVCYCLLVMSLSWWSMSDNVYWVKYGMECWLIMMLQYGDIWLV